MNGTFNERPENLDTYSLRRELDRGREGKCIFSHCSASSARFFFFFFSSPRFSSLYSSHYFRPRKETVEVEDEVDYRQNYLRLASQQPDNKALK